jgi:hypothetical protein
MQSASNEVFRAASIFNYLDAHAACHALRINRALTVILSAILPVSLLIGRLSLWPYPLP